MAKVKKAQKGAKATADSSAYYNNLTKKYYDEANKVANAPLGGKMLSEERKERNEKQDKLYKKASESTDNALRQIRKGKPGYDANGFPIKKAKDGKWIQKAIKKPGALRKSLGAKKGQPIPAGKLAAAAKKPGKMGQRARLAQTLKKMKKK
jgi:hypothetical protein